MNYLAIDTSGKHLTVLARKGEDISCSFLADCAHRHSVVLMDEIETTLRKVNMRAEECDFFAAVVGPGSFTGIRIGIATIKGLCAALKKPALSVTAFDTLAYAEKRDRILALVDAGHGAFYACTYASGKAGEGAYLAGAEVSRLAEGGFAGVSAEKLSVETALVSVSEGLKNAVEAKAGEAGAPSALEALYLRKSSAEEKR